MDKLSHAETAGLMPLLLRQSLVTKITVATETRAPTIFKIFRFERQLHDTPPFISPNIPYTRCNYCCKNIGRTWTSAVKTVGK